MYRILVFVSIVLLVILILLLMTQKRKKESFYGQEKNSPTDIRNIKILVINMEHSIDRREHIKKILKGFNYEFISAVNGKKLNNFNVITRHSLRPLTRGEVGCFLSHKKVYQKIVNSNESHCLVLEDDINLCVNFVSEINKCLSQINYFDIFYCFKTNPYRFYNQIGKDVKDYFPEKWDPKRPLALDQDYSNDCILASGPRLCTHAMIVSKKAAKQLINNMPFIQCPIDVQTHFKDVKKDLKIYASKKDLVYQLRGEFKSTVQIKE